MQGLVLAVGPHGKKLSTKTGKDGSFAITLPDGTYYLFGYRMHSTNGCSQVFLHGKPVTVITIEPREVIKDVRVTCQVI